MKTLLIALLTVGTTLATAQENPKFMNVMAVNGLNMRSKPESDARIVTKVAFGKQVEILEETKVQLRLGWITDNWYKVNYRGREGFIYGGYLSELKPPMEFQANRLSDLLPLYTTQNYQAQGQPTETIETDRRGDTLKHTLVKFDKGVELELEDAADSHTAMLILPATVQDAYVLLEALVKLNGMKEQLDNLRFVQNTNGDLRKVTNAAGTISIKEFADGRTAIKLKSYKQTNQF
ncbi:MAG: SH3 domain-containing protein [Flavobacteriales bacterium]|nr:SH3 domain-containing protein [Flavobacteriales bacterium]